MKGYVRLRGEKYSYGFKYKDHEGKWRTKEKGGFEKKSEAESAMRLAIQEFEDFGFLEIDRSSYTLNQYVDIYFESAAAIKLSPNTIKQYKGAYKIYVRSTPIGKKKLTKINVIDLEKLFVKLYKEKNSSLRHVKAVIVNTFDLALRHQLVKINPARITESLAVDPKREARALELSEIAKIRDALGEKRTDRPNLLAFEIALATGMRRSEILGLVWDDISLTKGVINVRKQLSENLERVKLKSKASERDVPIPKHLKQILWKSMMNSRERKAIYNAKEPLYYSDHDFVVTHDDGSPIKPNNINYVITRIQKASGVDFTFHDLRHTYATMLAAAGVSAKVIQKRLGHKSITTSMDIYMHVSEDMEKEAVDKFDTFLAENATKQ